MSRRPAVAGTFYNGNSDLLFKDIEQCFLGNRGPLRIPLVRLRQERKGNVLGLVAPHAGYIYSGAATAHAYYNMADDGIPETAVILGPNHRGLGEAASVASPDNWLTPMGTAHVDSETAEAILEKSKYAREDDEAHRKEHSIEVHVPFLQYLAGRRTKIVPISIAHLSYDDALELATDLGNAVADAIRDKNAIVISSTDMSHYESQEVAHSKDSMAIERILQLDAKGLLDVVWENDISMCGAVGTAVAIIAVKALGATKARQLSYYTSGDVTGDLKRVVGYCSVAFEK